MRQACLVNLRTGRTRRGSREGRQRRDDGGQSTGTCVGGVGGFGLNAEGSRALGQDSVQREGELYLNSITLAVLKQVRSRHE